MNYANKLHEREFNRILPQIDPNNRSLAAAVYLLSADVNLWLKSKPHVAYGKIDIFKLNLGSINESAYALYLAAKDIYLGTNYIGVSDLSDEKNIAPKTFDVICGAMQMRCMGLGATKADKGEDVYDHS